MVDVTSRPVTVTHVTISSSKSFEEVERALAKAVPVLDPGIQELMAKGLRDEVERIRDQGPPLWLFVTRQHGPLLAIEGRTAKANQYEIGNPITAESMTRWRLPAGLYAPLRVILYEDDAGRAVFEYDQPSSLFSQFDDPRVTEVALGLDRKLEAALMGAAG